MASVELISVQHVISVERISRGCIDADPATVTQVPQALADAVHELVMHGALWE
jgi:hypothetical protein